MATADLWVYNAEIVLCHFLTKLHPFFTYEGGKSNKKGFWGLPNIHSYRQAQTYTQLLICPKYTQAQKFVQEKLLHEISKVFLYTLFFWFAIKIIYF